VAAPTGVHLRRGGPVSAPPPTLASARSLTLGGRAVSLGWARVGDPSAAGLAPAESALLSARATPSRRAQFAAGRAAAREALRGLGLVPEALCVVRQPPTASDAGRPVVARADGGHLEAPPSLSLTHSGSLACAAAMIGAQTIGIDLECVEPVGSPAFEQEAFAPGELADFARFAAHGIAPITAAWTLKEAALKVWGVGLRAVLPAVRLVPGELERGPARGLVFTARVLVGAQPPGLPPPPLRLWCAMLREGAAVLSLAVEHLADAVTQDRGGSTPLRG